MNRTLLNALLLLLLPALLLSTSSFKPKDDPAMIKFDKLIHDFGKMKPGETMTCEFVFTNTGDLPLKLINVKTGVEFMKAEWSKDPVKKGEKASVSVTFTAPARNGQFTKTILIDSNSSGSSSQLRLTVKALIGAE